MKRLLSIKGAVVLIVVVVLVAMGAIYAANTAFDKTVTATWTVLILRVVRVGGTTRRELVYGLDTLSSMNKTLMPRTEDCLTHQLGWQP